MKDDSGVNQHRSIPRKIIDKPVYEKWQRKTSDCISACNKRERDVPVLVKVSPGDKNVRQITFFQGAINGSCLNI